MSQHARSRVRLIDIAERAGVSPMAVARVLNGTGGDNVRVGQSTRERIRKVAVELNYRPNRAAQQLRGVRSRLIGLILDSEWPSSFQRMSAIEREGIQRGYRFLVGQIHGDPRLAEQYLDDFDCRGVEAVICILQPTQESVEALRQLFAHRRNVLFHGQPSVDDGVCVKVDTADGVRQSVVHLLRRGRKRIGLALSNLTDEFNQYRRAAYCDCLHASEIGVDESLIWLGEATSQVPAAESAERAIDWLVVSSGADAIIAEDDVWAVRLIQRAKARGYHVPDDVAVVGYDNLDLAVVIEPALTTVDQRHGDYARQAMHLIVEMIENGVVTKDRRLTIVKPKLIVRDSA